jgi:carboxyl-terminal processing protease
LRLAAMHQAVCPPIAFAATRVRVVPARRASVVSRAWRKEHQVRRDGNDVTHVTHDVDETSILPPGTAFAKARRQLAATCVATCVALAVSGVTPPDATAITSNNLLFLEAWRAVDKAYVDKTFNGVSWFKYRETTVKKTSMDSTEETYEAIKVMLAKLDDPFTRFLEPEKYALLSESTMSANITGVGVEMAYSDDGGIVVVAPTPGGPADEAGVKPNDLIVAVDGRTVEGLSLYEVADQLQGPATSKVTISLQRDGNKSELIETSVTRRKYALVPVRSMVCDSDSVTNKKINYIRLTTFNQLSGSRVKEAVRSGAADGANAVVLDLRR